MTSDSQLEVSRKSVLINFGYSLIQGHPDVAKCAICEPVHSNIHIGTGFSYYTAPKAKSRNTLNATSDRYSSSTLIIK
jgi:hypothetical protein